MRLVEIAVEGASVVRVVAVPFVHVASSVRGELLGGRALDVGDLVVRGLALLVGRIRGKRCG